MPTPRRTDHNWLQSGAVVAERYQVAELLGAGTFGATYRVSDVRMFGQQKALKVLALPDQELPRRLFEREARVLTTLRHRGIPTIFDFFVQDDYCCLVQELIDGQTLTSRLRANGPMAPDEIERITRELLSVLAYLHDRIPPIVHRDVKPDNIMQRPDGSVVLIDYGAVFEVVPPVAGEQSTRIWSGGGFAAPELERGRALPASDVFGAAATALMLATNRLPKDLYDRITGELPSAAIIAPTLPSQLSAVLDACLQTDAAARPTAQAAIDSLSGAVAAVRTDVPFLELRGARGAPRPAEPAAPTMIARSQPSSRGLLRQPRMLVLGVTFAAALAGTGYWLRIGKDGPPRPVAPPIAVSGPNVDSVKLHSAPVRIEFPTPAGWVPQTAPASVSAVRSPDRAAYLWVEVMPGANGSWATDSQVMARVREVVASEAGVWQLGAESAPDSGVRQWRVRLAPPRDTLRAALNVHRRPGGSTRWWYAIFATRAHADAVTKAVTRLRVIEPTVP